MINYSYINLNLWGIINNTMLELSITISHYTRSQKFLFSHNEK